MDLAAMLNDLFDNSIIICAILGWVSAQVAKVFIHLFTEKEFNPKRVFGAGGMPSSHTATVVALASACGWVFGFNSPYFAISITLAVIVMHDAMGVRRETDKQSSLLKQLIGIIDDLSEKNVSQIINEKLKDFVGHTPLQVFCGGFVGLVATVIVMFVLKVPYAVPIA